MTIFVDYGHNCQHNTSNSIILARRRRRKNQHFLVQIPIRPSAIDSYSTVPARADPSQIGRGANNEFINGNGTPEKITE